MLKSRNVWVIEMILSEYTPERAERLNRLNFPEQELPFNMRLLWLEIINIQNMGHYVYNGLHSHSFYEIHFSFNGTAMYEVGGKEIMLEKNHLLLIPPGMVHRYIGGDEEIVKLSVAFSAEKNICNILHTQIPEEILFHANNLFQLIEHSDCFVPNLVAGRLLEILWTVFGTFGIEMPEYSEKISDSRIQVAKAFIKKNLHQIITCEDVAKECCLSVKQMGRIFKQTTGVSMSQYITEERMKYAKKLLLKKEHSVKEVGFLLGFENESSFVSFFKRHGGMPPGEFQKQNFKEREKMSVN